MSDAETTEATEPAEATAEAEQPDDTTEQESPNSEAAKYRKRLREAEAERDTLAQRLEAVQRQQVEALLGGVKPEALWAVTELAALLTEDGSIDADKVTAAIDAAREKFGITKPSKGNHVPGIGNRPTIAPAVDKWKEAFTPNRRR
ncbi:MAG TPA: hypothetical protein PLK19_16980 [Mycobacterium sp.]|nr:hypothetical protein [Mycobacterium sp.]